MNAVEALAVLDISYKETLHLDPIDGHTQVQEVYPDYDFDCGPADRLRQIHERQLWSEFQAMAQTKSDQWLLQIALYLDADDAIALCRILRLIVLASSDDTKIALFSYSYNRQWGAAELSLVAGLQQIFSSMLPAQQQADDMLGFLEPDLQQQAVDRLNELASSGE